MKKNPVRGEKLPRQDGLHSGGTYGQNRDDKGDDVIICPNGQGEMMVHTQGIMGKVMW